MAKHKLPLWAQLGAYGLLVSGGLLFAGPFLWLLGSSFKPEPEVGALTPWPVSFWTLESYRFVWERLPILRGLANSLLVAGSVTLLVLLTGAMAGYALARLRWRGREFLFNLALFTMTVPGILLLIPLYTLIVQLGWTDSPLGLIAPYAANAMAVLIFRQSFLSIPQELLDAARLDGCSEWRLLWTVVWPLSKPAFATVGILTFLSTWNEVLWPLMVVRDERWMTLPQLVTLFAVGGGAEAQMGPQLAAAVLLALPVVAAYAILQRHFVRSLAQTGLKG
ncbi:MAG: carbohydrate ABC transporter permease [Bacteroidota bacterium]|nr:carbohydrate ABC transporter permease [Rhodothermia bacterium]MCS7155952.1 carbohydrate ABC transporter permease [Bacteroidota bacterium]MDW8138075.1 carbohydrate ABC transporter permease [Bacteroidota bacterium]MDW8285759.1 carbohydrate ABC transporter permease [Bacteroidota bacterium]